MNGYLQLFRMGNALMGAIGVLVACFMAVGFDITDHAVNLLISIVVVFMFICGGNALNDYIDYEIDRTAHPERPIPSGRLDRRSALRAGVLMFAVSILISFITCDPECIAIVIVACMLMVSYELYLKQRGLIGNVTIAVLTGMMFLLGGAVAGSMMNNMVVALMAMLVSIGREISKDIEDMDSDEGRITLPMRIGTRNAALLASVFFIAGPVLSIQPMIAGTYGLLYYTVLLADAMFVLCAVSVFKDPHKAQKLAKKAMLVALISFILGVIRF
ncbi:MAG: geranylgeranylglycerol-phosphate geranylgeranyltransferase [Candidatus Methanomethylophilaceae archaeon]